MGRRENILFVSLLINVIKHIFTLESVICSIFLALNSAIKHIILALKSVFTLTFDFRFSYNGFKLQGDYYD